MNDPCQLFRSQYEKAKETLDLLLNHKTEIELKLLSDASNAFLNKELRILNMDIRITENEMEHAEFRRKECELKYNLPSF